MENSPLSTPFGTPTTPPENSSSVISSDHLTISQLANLPREKKPLPRFLLALIIVSALALAAVFVAVLEAVEISRLNATRGIDPSSLSVLVWKKNAAALALPPSSFAFDSASNTLELTDLSLATQLAPENPVLSSFNSLTLLRPVFVSLPLLDSSRLVLVTENGALSSCLLAPASADPSSLTPSALLSAVSVPDGFTACTLSGLRGEIYKFVEFSASPAPSSSSTTPETYLAVIYTDGSVDYLALSFNPATLPLNSASEDNPTSGTNDTSAPLPTLTISGPLALSGVVRDIIPLTSTRLSTTADGTELSTVSNSAAFVLSDGSYLLFDPSMFLTDLGQDDED